MAKTRQPSLNGDAHANAVELKDFFDERFARFEERIEHERDLRVLAATAVDDALELQTEQNMRHFDLLNNNHARMDALITEMKANYIGREKHEDFVLSTNRWREELVLTMARTEATRAATALAAEKATQRLILIITIGLSVLSLVLKFVPLSSH